MGLKPPKLPYKTIVVIEAALYCYIYWYVAASVLYWDIGFAEGKDHGMWRSATTTVYLICMSK